MAPARARRGERSEAPPRPGVIEFVSAVLIVSGVVRLFAIAVALMAAEGGRVIPSFIVAGEIGLQVLAIATGVAARYGRAWIAVVNIVAVLAFIELLALPSVISLAFGILFGFAFAAIFLNKPWFDALAAHRAAERDDGSRQR